MKKRLVSGITGIALAGIMIVLTACGNTGSAETAPADNTDSEAEATEVSPDNSESDAEAANQSADDTAADAEALDQPEEEEEFMPGSFVEEAAGKETFDSFDELISYLKGDNGYTYFELEGYDGKLLAVTEGTFDDLDGHRAAIDATFYGDIDGQVRFIGNAFSNGTAYPIRCDGTLIYSAGNHEYNSEFMSEDGTGLIVKDYIHVEYDESGNPTYTGFHRETNASEGEDIPADPAEAEKIFDSLITEMEEKEVMDFTVAGADDQTVSAASASLPAYEYPGPEAFYSVLYQYLIDEYAGDYPAADVTIPCPIIIAEDESDKNDIKVWGNFWVMNYDLKGDTLENTSGGSYPGLIHIQSIDEAPGYKVTKMEVVADGTDNEPSAKTIFGKYYEDLVKSDADEENFKNTRAQIIANYAAANNLDIKAYKDYGWDPVTLPEENIDNFYSNLQ